MVLFHFAFVAFVALGGLLALRWRRLGWLHIPAVLWVIWIETTGKICPLTPMENRLREQAGIATYEGGFVDHYIMPILYPRGLTADTQITIAVTLVVMNILSYGLIAGLAVRRRRRMRAAAVEADPVDASPAGGDAADELEAVPAPDAPRFADAHSTPDNPAPSPALPPVR